jgi:hypothetical protein
MYKKNDDDNFLVQARKEDYGKIFANKSYKIFELETYLIDIVPNKGKYYEKTMQLILDSFFIKYRGYHSIINKEALISDIAYTLVLNYNYFEYEAMEFAYNNIDVIKERMLEEEMNIIEALLDKENKIKDS